MEDYKIKRKNRTDGKEERVKVRLKKKRKEWKK